MERTTIMANEHTLQTLRLLAQARGTSFATVVREALEEKAGEYRPLPKSLGIGQSGPSATAATSAAERQPPRSWR